MPDLSWPLQRKLLRTKGIGFNAEVYNWFKADEEIPSRKALRDSLLIQAKESRTSTSFKIQYFREFVQKTHLKPAIIGATKEDFDSKLNTAYRPLVELAFQQDRAAVPNGYYPVKAQIAFRLMDETTETLTMANVQTLARQIKTELAAGSGYTFDKGKYICSYVDEHHGYNLKLYVTSDAEGEQLARKIVSIRNHPFTENNFKTTAPRKDSVNTSSTIKILGETVKKPRWRPTARVRFLSADLIIYNKPDPICLVDRTGRKYAPIERVY